MKTECTKPEVKLNKTFTPGPWKVDTINGKPYVIDSDTGNFCTARVHGVDSTLWANAHLIASAPDILSALIGCADALKCAGQEFAMGNPYAARPNLYEMHEAHARRIIFNAIKQH